MLQKNKYGDEQVQLIKKYQQAWYEDESEDEDESESELSFEESFYVALDNWFNFNDSLPMSEVVRMCTNEEEEEEMKQILRGKLFRYHFATKDGKIVKNLNAAT